MSDWNNNPFSKKKTGAQRYSYNSESDDSYVAGYNQARDDFREGEAMSDRLRNSPVEPYINPERETMTGAEVIEEYGSQYFDDPDVWSVEEFIDHALELERKAAIVNSILLSPRLYADLQSAFIKGQQEHSVFPRYQGTLDEFAEEIIKDYIYGEGMNDDRPR